MVVCGAGHGEAETAALVAALVSERGLGGDHPDLTWRLDRLRRDGSPRARDARALAARWAKLAGGRTSAAEPIGEARLLAMAYPERVARARGKPGEFRLANGRGVFLDPANALARETWLAVGELGGGASRDRILLAAALDPARIAEDFADQIQSETILDTDAAGRVKAKRITRLGRLVVEERQVEAKPALIEAALLDSVGREGLAALPDNPSLSRLLARVAFLRSLDPTTWSDLSEAELIARRAEWLGPLLHGRSSLAGLDPQAVSDAVRRLLPWDLHSRLERDAPERFKAPTGNRHQIDYAAEGGPRIDVRVQELFGLAEHPTIAGGRIPLTVALLSPAHRPVQTTRDLPGFWRGSYAAVRTEMRGRYPRHPWPEDPLAAAPSTRAKPRRT
jgi:ATP-dependent helicase HrpB